VERRDLLKDQIEQLGKVLAKILVDFMGFKSTGQASKGIEICNQQLKTELDIDVEELLVLSKDELKDFFIERGITASHLEILTDYLTELGISKKETDQVMANQFFQKAIDLLDLADQITRSVSYTRINKKQILQKNIQE